MKISKNLKNPKSEFFFKFEEITFFQQNSPKKMLISKFCHLIEEISIQPEELSSQPRFRIQGAYPERYERRTNEQMNENP